MASGIVTCESCTLAEISTAKIGTQVVGDVQMQLAPILVILNPWLLR